MFDFEDFAKAKIVANCRTQESFAWLIQQCLDAKLKLGWDGGASNWKYNKETMCCYRDIDSRIIHYCPLQDVSIKVPIVVCEIPARVPFDGDEYASLCF
jgi:hypothetical protein